MITDPSRVPLSRRAWIGDGERGALVAADGTIDWYCPTGLAAAPAFWHLLDPAGGAVRVGPVREGTGAARRLPPSIQTYRQSTNVVETILEGAGGRRVAVVDVMPWPGPGLETPGRIVRLVEALSGPVEVEVEVLPAGAWGRARDVYATSDGLVVDDLRIRSGLELVPAPLGRDTPRWRATRRLDAGEALVVTIGPLENESGVTVDGARRQIADTELAWRSWLKLLTFDGPHRPAVERAVLALRSLTGRQGAPAAAGTTSLPRRVGGERTADDRWIRVRDVAHATVALARVGLAEDAEAAENWLRNTLTTAPRPWAPWLDADGQPVEEREERGVAGWRRSQPVVTGRAEPAPDLGLLGAIAAAVGASTRGPGGNPSAEGPLSAAWPALSAAADWVVDHWGRADAGRWDLGGPPRLLTSSRFEAWSGLEVMARLAWAANPLDLDAAGWHQEAGSIARWLEDWALAPDGGLGLAGGPGSDYEADAALLAVAWMGPWPAHSPVVERTVDRVLERLTSDNLLYRYPDSVDDGRPGSDSPDLEASLLAVRALARLHRWEEAYTRMEAVLGLTGPAGLLSEAADPVAGELLGNLPSTSVDLALIEAVVALAEGPA